MTLEMGQLDDITQDAGFREDAERFAKERLKKYEDLYICMQIVVRDAYLKGLQSGFNCGYIKGYKTAENDLNPVIDDYKSQLNAKTKEDF